MKNPREFELLKLKTRTQKNNYELRHISGSKLSVSKAAQALREEGIKTSVRDNRLSKFGWDNQRKSSKNILKIYQNRDTTLNLSQIQKPLFKLTPIHRKGNNFIVQNISHIE
jgi:hypothetical protein